MSFIDELNRLEAALANAMEAYSIYPDDETKAQINALKKQIEEIKAQNLKVCEGCEE